MNRQFKSPESSAHASAIRASNTESPLPEVGPIMPSGTIATGSPSIRHTHISLDILALLVDDVEENGGQKEDKNQPQDGDDDDDDPGQGFSDVDG